LAHVYPGLTIKPEIIQFRILAGENFGLMEFVENSIPLRDFEIEKLFQCTEEEIDQFLATAAGGYLGGFLLGIRDRHEGKMKRERGSRGEEAMEPEQKGEEGGEEKKGKGQRKG
jgi:hypothetical protein